MSSLFLFQPNESKIREKYFMDIPYQFDEGKALLKLWFDSGFIELDNSIHELGENGEDYFIGEIKSTCFLKQQSSFQRLSYLPSQCDSLAKMTFTLYSSKRKEILSIYKSLTKEVDELDHDREIRGEEIGLKLRKTNYTLDDGSLFRVRFSKHTYPVDDKVTYSVGISLEPLCTGNGTDLVLGENE